MPRTCPRCGRKAGDGDRFCGSCGTTLAGVSGSAAEPHAFCTRCGAPLTAGDRFCARCGAASGAPAEGEDETESFDPDDFFRDWDRDRVPSDEARTEQVMLRPAGQTDTAVLPVVAADDAISPRPGEAAPRPERETFPWGAAFAFAGATAVVASSALPLARAGRTILPRDVAVSALLFPEGPARGPSLGLVLLGLGVVGALVALLTMAAPRVRVLRRLIGLLTLAVPVLVLVRLLGSGTSFVDLPGVLGASVYLSLGGALTQVIAGRWFRR